MTDNRVGSKWGDDNESTLTLLWTCLFTIFACTYTVVDLNYPKIGESSRKITQRRLGWFLLIVLVPEWTLYVAMGQYNECTEIKKLMKSLGYSDWTRTHSFFLFMGGFKLQSQDGKICRLDKSSVERLHKVDVEPPFRMPELSRQEIEDHGRVDSLAKAIVRGQLGWMMMQIIARAAERLPVSQLEVMALGYVALAILCNCFWWHKPFDARTPIVILFDIDEYLSPANASSWARRKGNNAEDARWDKSSNGSYTYGLTGILSISIAGAVFGSINCIGWNFSFASRAELILWRTCSICITLFPPTLASLYCLADYARHSFNYSRYSDLFERLGSSSFMVWCGISVFFLYFAARIILLFQTLFCLRSMPAAAFTTYTSVAWVNYIPHFG